MLTELFVEQIDLVIEDFNTNEDASFVVAATADGFLFTCFWVFTENVFVIWILFHCFGVVVDFVKVKWQQYQIVIKILK